MEIPVFQQGCPDCQANQRPGEFKKHELCVERDANSTHLQLEVLILDSDMLISDQFTLKPSAPLPTL